ncbi:hypothetical protein B0H19DRAFT_1243443 [Mycena capillaripes]|nr:hypothetical protein B0H19DRAFT_1243443 [Mycena capillaripes]
MNQVHQGWASLATHGGFSNMPRLRMSQNVIQSVCFRSIIHQHESPAGPTERNHTSIQIALPPICNARPESPNSNFAPKRPWDFDSDLFVFRRLEALMVGGLAAVRFRFDVPLSSGPDIRRAYVTCVTAASNHHTPARRTRRAGRFSFHQQPVDGSHRPPISLCTRRAFLAVFQIRTLLFESRLDETLVFWLGRSDADEGREERPPGIEEDEKRCTVSRALTCHHHLGPLRRLDQFFYLCVRAGQETVKDVSVITFSYAYGRTAADYSSAKKSIVVVEKRFSHLPSSPSNLEPTGRVRFPRIVPSSAPPYIPTVYKAAGEPLKDVALARAACGLKRGRGFTNQFWLRDAL